MGLLYIKYGEKFLPLLSLRVSYKENLFWSLLHPVYILLNHDVLTANSFFWFSLMYKTSVLKDITVAQCKVIGQNVECEGFKTCLQAHLQLIHPPFLRG